MSDCEWGFQAVICRQPATSTRQRKATGKAVRLCDEHARTLDRIYQSVERDRPILNRLAEEEK